MILSFESLIIPGIIMIMILLFVAYVIPKLVKLVLVIIAIYLLFHVGYIWSSEEAAEYLHLDKWMNEEYQEKFTTLYEEYTTKRNEKDGVVDVVKVKEMMDTTISAAQADLSEISDEEKAKMKEYWSLIFSSLSSEEAKQLLEKTKESWSKVFTHEEMDEMIPA